MQMKYISKIQANMKRYQSVKARKATARVLDGSYKSIHKGRSMNFDELREYVQGDDIKDIDWKASARSQKMLVRQYIAERKHNILLVFDTNMNMLGDSDGFEEKRELAIMSAGTLAYFVNKSGDYVASTFMTKDGVKYYPFKAGLGNIELILENYHRSVTMDNKTDINECLEYIIRNFKQKTIIVLVTDVRGFKNITDSNLKRLLVAHDVLALNISDASVDKRGAYNLGSMNQIPDFLSKNKKLQKSIKETNLRLQAEVTEKLKKYGISCSTIDYLDELDKEIVDLLAKHRGERIRK
ncbi:MAG: DUF58 domain-containing protein [Lachnospiraceae bacterium]|nr:DUF58 domain-containing protein [Lachnospiraceae bacterium]